MTENEPMRSRKEEAEYWETHTIDEVEGEGQEEAVVVRKPLSSVFSIRLAAEDVKQLREMADAQGVGPTTMARRLLRQCLSDPYSMPPQIVRGAVGSLAYMIPQALGGPKIDERLDRLLESIESLVKQSSPLYLRPADPEEQPKQHTGS